MLSDSFTLMFNPTTIAIITQPQDKLNLNANVSTTFSVIAQSTETLSYQWELSCDNGNTWDVADNVTSVGLSADNKFMIYRVEETIPVENKIFFKIEVQE